MAKTQRKSKSSKRPTPRKTARGSGRGSAAKSARRTSGSKSGGRGKTKTSRTAKQKTTKQTARKPAAKSKTARRTTTKTTRAKSSSRSHTRAAAPAPAKGSRARQKDTTKKSSTGKGGAGKSASKTAAKGAKTAPGASAPKGAGEAPKAAGDKGAEAAPPRKPAARTAAERRAAVMPVKPKVEPKPRSRRKKGPFNRRQLNPLRKALLELRARIARDLNLMGDEAFRASDPEVDAEDVADMGSDAFERTMTLNLMEKDATTLKKVHEALDLMDEGSYGLCVECNEPIPMPRLEALPFAQTCVPCQEQQERLH